MFVCAVCANSADPRVKPVRVVVEARNVTYPERPLANDPGGHGTEIVREVNVCPACVGEVVEV